MKFFLHTISHTCGAIKPPWGVAITFDQIHYINLLQSLNQKLINNRNTISDIVQSAVEKLFWVCGQTRPDISFEVCQLATNIKNSDGSSIKNVNKLFWSMKQNECKSITLIRCFKWFYLMKLFSEVMFNSNSKIPIEVVIDNKSLFKEKRN